MKDFNFVLQPDCRQTERERSSKAMDECVFIPLTIEPSNSVWRRCIERWFLYLLLCIWCLVMARWTSLFPKQTDRWCRSLFKITIAVNMLMLIIRSGKHALHQIVPIVPVDGHAGIVANRCLFTFSVRFTFCSDGQSGTTWASDGRRVFESRFTFSRPSWSFRRTDGRRSSFVLRRRSPAPLSSAVPYSRHENHSLTIGGQF